MHIIHCFKLFTSLQLLHAVTRLISQTLVVRAQTGRRREIQWYFDGLCVSTSVLGNLYLTPASCLQKISQP